MADVVIAGYGPAGAAAAIAAHDAGHSVLILESGEALWDLLDAAVRARGIEVRCQSAVERLMTGPGGSVTGVVARGTEVAAAGGVILACGGFEAGTTGGPRHDERARVLRPDGQPVPGLYAAGAVSLAWGHLIEHGGGLTDAMVFGRIAGAEAASRTATAPGPGA